MSEHHTPATTPMKHSGGGSTAAMSSQSTAPVLFPTATLEARFRWAPALTRSKATTMPAIHEEEHAFSLFVCRFAPQPPKATNQPPSVGPLSAFSSSMLAAHTPTSTPPPQQTERATASKVAMIGPSSHEPIDSQYFAERVFNPQPPPLGVEPFSTGQGHVAQLIDDDINGRSDVGFFHGMCRGGRWGLICPLIAGSSKAQNGAGGPAPLFRGPSRSQPSTEAAKPKESTKLPIAAPVAVTLAAEEKPSEIAAVVDSHADARRPSLRDEQETRMMSLQHRPSLGAGSPTASRRRSSTLAAAKSPRLSLKSPMRRDGGRPSIADMMKTRQNSSDRFGVSPAASPTASPLPEPSPQDPPQSVVTLESKFPHTASGSNRYIGRAGGTRVEMVDTETLQPVTHQPPIRGAKAVKVDGAASLGEVPASQLLGKFFCQPATVSASAFAGALSKQVGTKRKLFKSVKGDDGAMEFVLEPQEHHQDTTREFMAIFGDATGVHVVSSQREEQGCRGVTGLYSPDPAVTSLPPGVYEFGADGVVRPAGSFPKQTSSALNSIRSIKEWLPPRSSRLLMDGSSSCHSLTSYLVRKRCAKGENIPLVRIKELVVQEGLSENDCYFYNSDTQQVEGEDDPIPTVAESQFEFPTHGSWLGTQDPFLAPPLTTANRRGHRSVAK